MQEKNKHIILELLKKRGIADEADILEFLSEKPTRTYDPFLLLNMEAGVDLILSTIQKREKICIYGDYDCDGITSVCLLMQFLSNLTDNLEYYIPSRFDEGYGLNMEAIRKIHQGGAQLLVTVDCGSVSWKEAELAKELGMDILITDHHNLGEKIPDCLVINPKQENCPYPFKELAGCGVAFKLAQAIQKKMGMDKASISELLDLVGIGTIGDIVPLIDENRTLTKYGIRSLNNTNRQGLVKLIRQIGLKPGEITSENIAYAIVPHINSAGRITKPEIAVNLLQSADEKVQDEAVDSLVSSNRERRRLQEEAYKHCVTIIEEKHLWDDFKVIFAEDAHEGITGIVAGKIKDRYERPTIIVTSSGEYLKGTGRSIPSIDIHRVLKGASELFMKFGGHSGACGFLMEKNHLEPLRNYLKLEMERLYSENSEVFTVERKVDLDLRGEDIDLTLAYDLEKMAPFGHSNEKPYFRLPEMSVEKLSSMGTENNHLRFDARSVDGASIPCVLFGEAQKYLEILSKNQKVFILGYPNINKWNNSVKIQFVVQEIKW